MPFVQRIVEPRYLSRTSLHNDNGQPLVNDCELEAVTNNTLSNALRQLASLVLVANDIFIELTKELQNVSERSSRLKVKIGVVDGKLSGYDPKKIPVPEGDISTFALLRTHYTRPQELTTGLFSAESRPDAVRSLYEAAARTPVHAMRQLDRWRKDGHRSSRFFLCTPVLGAKRRKIRTRVDIDIETKMPAAVEELRRWTSSEAIGDITVATDCVNRITSNSTVEDLNAVDVGATSDDDAIDHKLPSPEEQLQVIALKFPAEIVPVDVSGRRFDRMSNHRRSLLHSETVCEEDANGTVRRRTRTRKPRGKRRNTLAGTDQKEIRDALEAGDEPTTISLEEPESPESGPVFRSRSTDILRTKKSSPPDGKKSHFDTLKQWGKSRLKLINKSLESKSDNNKSDDIDDINIYETIKNRKRRNIDKESKSTHERKTSYSSSEKSSNISLPISTPLSAAMNIAVKLRESSAVRRQRRNKDEQHSSSGNWSASSESGRASIGSEITTHPKSTTSTATSNNSLGGPPSSVHSRRRFPPSASSSVTSEGTLTPDIHDIHDDGETSSVYSCDTEGYYTSFHMDSGLKTLKEEEFGMPSTPLHTTSAFSSSGNSTVLTAENEYELFGKGSTSTTTSSAGTVCTTLRAAESHRSLTVGPAVPERKSSLNSSTSNSLERETGTIKRSPASTKATIVAVVHKHGDVSPDSGHNTSSSPIESVSSPNGPPSCSEFEFSESSDLEGVERIERIRIKTTINSSRIPSMCHITPPHSDDESVSDDKKNNFNIPDLGSKNAIRPKLNLPLTETNLDISETQVLPKVQISINPNSGYATINEDSGKNYRAPSPSGGTLTVKEENKPNKSPNQPIIKATLLPLNNMLGKLKTNLTNFTKKEKVSPEVKFDSGDYVTIADVRNNNEKGPITEVLYANEVKTEYVCLNELPQNSDTSSSLERRRQGARVTLDAEGKVVYSSDSLKRRKGHSTFEPGLIKTTSLTASPLPVHRTPRTIRPVNNNEKNRPLSPQMNKIVIRADTTAESVRMPPAMIVRPSRGGSNVIGGAYVHMQDDRGISLSPAHEEERALSPSRNQQTMHPQTADRYYHRDSPVDYQQHQRNDFLQRNSPLYRTLPSRINHNYNDGHYQPQFAKKNLQPSDIYEYKFSSLPRRQQYSENIPVYSPNYATQVPSTVTPNRESKINFFSPIPKNKDQQTLQNESLKISPIDPRNIGGFQSSTPAKKEISSVNLSNKLLSPKKSTMSNEELYAVIHKSKKKLNIKTEDIEKSIPVCSSSPGKSGPVKQPETGYIGEARNRNSWSPNNDLALKEPGSRQSWACSDRIGVKQTSRLDFKKLLLQHGTKSNIVQSSSNKLSAVEQLKLTKNLQQPPAMNILDLSSSPKSFSNRKNTNIPPGSPEKQRPPSKLLSPRSNWRFANPRSDVLSSTILEDCREDESPHSSLEKSNSFRKSPIQYGVARSNADNRFAKNIQHIPQSIEGGMPVLQRSIDGGKPLLSRTQLLQAQRAEFFKTASNKSPPNSFFSRDRARKTPSPPTLETAL